MNEKLKAFVQVAPLLKSITCVDAAIGIWDENSVVQEYIKADNMDLFFEKGTKIDDPNLGLNRVLRTGKAEHEKLPKEALGVAIDCTVTPIFDGNKVVGAITYSISSEVKDRIDMNIDKLSNYVENTSLSINGIANGAEKLKSNINNVEHVTEDVVTKLNEALSVVEEIKQNAKLSNILALNASIESARAGEAGKGFAVVSDEMRKFSRMSAEASEKINSTLAEITKSLDGVKEDITKSTIIANEQSESVNELSVVFNDVSKSASEVSADCKNFYGKW